MQAPEQPPGIDSKTHRQHVAQYWCVVCMGGVLSHAGYTVSQCCHVRIGFGTTSRRPCDTKTVPMCPEHHVSQHDSNEAEWWESKGIDPFEIGRKIAANSPDKRVREKVDGY